MTLDEYTQRIKKWHAHPFLSDTDKQRMWRLGLIGELGEVAELLKKDLGHNQPLDKTHLLEELGDLMWYACSVSRDGYYWNTLDVFENVLVGESLSSFAEGVNILAQRYGFSLGDVLDKNVDKLEQRWPKGFLS